MAIKNFTKSLLTDPLSRRTFLSSAVVTGSAAAVGVGLSRRAQADTSEELHYDLVPDSLVDATYVYTTCLMCHSDCGMKVRVVDGVAVKIEGNPYHPHNLESDERLAYSEDPATHEATNGRLCAKGQAALETLYNPYRLKAPMKRVGPRGGGEWETVAWDDALDEFAGELEKYHSQTAMTNSYGDSLGPEANRVLFSRGRLENGPGEFVNRWFNKCFGTINAVLGHTSICEASRHVASKLCNGGTKHMKSDMENTTYVVLWGTSPTEAGFPMQSYARKVMRAINDRGATVVVVDPRFSNTAAKGSKWVPIKPGTDGALALAMAHYIMENDLYDTTFLQNPNSTAAAADGESCYSDSTLLVRADTGKFLTGNDLDGGGSTDYVVWTGGATALSAVATTGDLFVNGQVVALSSGSTVAVSSVFQLFYNRVMERSMNAYSAICEVPVDTIEEIALGFASAGKTSSSDVYRGVCGHTNGVYASLAIMALNHLVGNHDHKGGMSKGGSYYHDVSGLYDLSTVTGGYSNSGVAYWRSGSGTTDYFSTKEYLTEGIPARRPWLPFATEGNFQELIPSMAAEYPYKVGVYITYCNNTVYTTPGSRLTAARVLGDESILPYFVAIDIEMSETTCFADLIIPDTMFLEQWACPHLPSPITKVNASPIRQPVVGTVNTTNPAADGYEAYLPEIRDMVDWLLDLGERLGLPGQGADGITTGVDLYNSWDWYGRIFENIVHDFNEIQGTEYTVDEMLARGGVFEDSGAEYDGDMLTSKVGKRLNFYLESFVSKRDSQTGEYYDPLPKHDEPADLMGNTVADMDGGYPFALITYKPAFHTQSRTAFDPSLMMLQPENFAEMNASDGAALGLETGDMVRMYGPSGGTVTGRVKLTQGMKPGVVAIANSYGHWELGSRPHMLDGEVSGYDASRGAGIHANSLMRLDDRLGDVCLTDKVGGNASYYDTRIRVEKV